MPPTGSLAAPSTNAFRRSSGTVSPVSARKIPRLARDTAAVAETGARRPCTRCATPKPPDAFPPARRKRNGRSSHCRDCANAATREWRATCRDELNAARRVHHPARACLGCGLEFAPRRSDAWHCCKYCADWHRMVGQPAPDWQAVHRAGHPRTDTLADIAFFDPLPDRGAPFRAWRWCPLGPYPGVRP